MSINVKCTIEVTDEQYEAGTKHQEIFTVSQNASSTGVFSALPGAFVRSCIEGASSMATEEALRRLKAIKGDILFSDEEAVGVLKQVERRANKKASKKAATPKPVKEKTSDE